ncbi:MAG: hypothetical protein AAGA87_10665 [Pseudomonadota bacterium]
MRVFKRGGDAPCYVQIYGERNSGTTYLSKLIQDNMRVSKNLLGLAKSEATPLGHDVFGYKHWFPVWEKLADPRQAETLFLVIYRNPYTWIRAMMDKPYALSRSLSGRTIADLPAIKLAGHMNGKDTKNEFDPVTGEQLTIFELREKKIEYWEELKSRVANVAYVNYEDLLENPPGVVEGLADRFPGLFSQPLSLDRKPFREQLEEFKSPVELADAERDAIESAIHWDSERAIGYRKGEYSVVTESSVPFVILHGGSSVGKSYSMKQAALSFQGAVGLEMDDCKYWEEYEPVFDLDLLRRVIPSATERDLSELMDLVDTRKLSAVYTILFRGWVSLKILRGP